MSREQNDLSVHGSFYITHRHIQRSKVEYFIILHALNISHMSCVLLLINHGINYFMYWIMKLNFFNVLDNNF